MISKQRRSSKDKIHQAIGQRLRYGRRNLSHVKNIAEMSDLRSIERLVYKGLLLIHELYRQQSIMYKKYLAFKIELSVFDDPMCIQSFVEKQMHL